MRPILVSLEIDMAFAEPLPPYPLGVSEGGVQFLDAVRAGLPVSVAEDIAARLAPNDPSFRYQIVPKATLARRKHTQRLSPEEGERAMRLVRLFARTVRFWKDEDAARRFLWRPNMVLGMRRPIDLALAGETGGRMVEDLLGQGEAGVAV